VACVGRSTKRLAGYIEDNDLPARLAPESVAISLHWFVTSRASRRCHRAANHYLMRFRLQAFLISQMTIINMVSTTIGAVNVANVVSILHVPER
jgi:hypothetical protein